MAVKLGPTTDITFLSGFISSQLGEPEVAQQDSRPWTRSWSQAITTTEATLIATACRHRDRPRTHNCSATNCTGALQSTCTRRAKEAQTQLNGQALSKKIRQRAVHHKPLNSISINTVSRTWFTVCPTYRSPDKFYHVPMLHSRNQRDGPYPVQRCRDPHNLQTSRRGHILIFI